MPCHHFFPYGLHRFPKSVYLACQVAEAAEQLDDIFDTYLEESHHCML